MYPEVVYQCSQWLDMRMAISAIALIVSFGSLITTVFLRNSDRRRQELRDHFDKDIRDVAFEAFKELRKYRQKITHMIIDAQYNPCTEKLVSNIDTMRDKEIGPILFEIQQVVHDARMEYGHRIGNEKSQTYAKRIENAYDRLMEAISTIRRQASRGQVPIDLSQFNGEVYNFTRTVRELMNDIRSVISTTKGQKFLNR